MRIGHKSGSWRPFAAAVAVAALLFAGQARAEESSAATDEVAFYFGRLGLDAITRGDFRSARRRFERAAESAKRWMLPRCLLAWIDHRERHDEEAQRRLQSILQAQSLHAYACGALWTWFHHASGCRLTAVQAFESLDEALEALANRRYAEAAKFAGSAAAVHEPFPLAHCVAGYACDRVGNAAQAVSHYRAALAQDSGNLYARFALMAEPEPADKPSAEPAEENAPHQQYERLLFELINRERINKALPPLKYSARLATVARKHSAEMRDRSYFSHESPTKSLHTILDRYLAEFQRRPRAVRENIARTWGDQPALSEKSIRASHQDLMNSPGHRANILADDVTEVGVGVVSNPHGDYWITEFFAHP